MTTGIYIKGTGDIGNRLFIIVPAHTHIDINSYINIWHAQYIYTPYTYIHMKLHMRAALKWSHKFIVVQVSPFAPNYNMCQTDVCILMPSN